MSASGDTAPPDRASRPEGGFDRFDASARDGWAVLWRASSRGRFIMGRDRSVWLWDAQVKQWKRLAADQEAIALRDHEWAMNRLRRALLAVRTLQSKIEAEREAARQAMQRMASAIVGEWRRAGHADNTTEAGHWFDHPAGIYLAATRDCRHHFAEELRQPFDLKLFATLVQASYADVKAGLRAQPPRLRPEDMGLLELQPEALDTGPPPPEMTDFMHDFRDSVSESFARADRSHGPGRLGQGGMIAGLILLAGLLGFLLVMVLF